MSNSTIIYFIQFSILQKWIIIIVNDPIIKIIAARMSRVSTNRKGRPELISHSQPNFHYTSKLSSMKSQTKLPSLIQQSQDSVPLQSNPYGTTINIPKVQQSEQSPSAVNPEKNGGQSFRRCANQLLKSSPHNFVSTYKRFYTAPDQDYDANNIDYNKYGPPKTERKIIGEKSIYNKLESMTTYRADYQPEQLKNQIKATNKNWHSSNNLESKVSQRNKMVRTKVFAHRHGKDADNRVNIGSTAPFSEYYEDRKIAGETEYRKNFAKPEQTNLFKLSQREAGISSQLSNKKHHRMVTEPSNYGHQPLNFRSSKSPFS